MILTVVDHASNHVPPEVDLGIEPSLLRSHIAWDIGAAALARALAFPAHLASVSRLVIDVNREEDSPGLIPSVSDGVVIPGNIEVDRKARLAAYYRPYHQMLARRIASARPHLLLSLHSFTPQLTEKQEQRPWHIGVLYNNDDRAARVALPMLEATGLCVGDQLPYSGKLLNASMNRHGEGTGTPYLGLEVRQDLIGDEAGVARIAALLRPAIETVGARFRSP